MTKYKVVREFTDSQDELHGYRVGDKYPRSGRAKKERVEELSGSDNKIGAPVIVEEKEEGDE